MCERNVVEYLKDLLEETNGIRPLSRNENGDIICYQCGRVAKEHCHSEAGLREVEISGLCEECFDKLFEEDEEDEEDEEEPLLSDFLEELKTYKEGVFLDKTISIFYNDWSLNPYYDDDYSERVDIKIAKLRDLNSQEFKSYKVAWWDQSYVVSNYVEICVKKNENS